MPVLINAYLRYGKCRSTLICSHQATADFVFGIATAILGIVRRVIYRWKGIFKTFPTVCNTPFDDENCTRNSKNKICSRLATADFILRITTAIFINSKRLVTTVGKVFSRPFQRYITRPKMMKIAVVNQTTKSAIACRLQILFWNCDCNFRNFGACYILLERSFQDLSNGILHAPKFLKLQS